MPELPEVETVMRALAAKLAGRRVVELVQRRPDLRFALPAGLPGRLAGRRFDRFGRRAKYIRVDLDDGHTLLLHLGMSGRLVLDGPPLEPPSGPHEHLSFGFDDGSVLRFVDARRFGMLDLWPSDRLAEHRWLAHLGLEPLGPDFTGRRLRALFAGRRSAIKSALMDQRLVVGVGNIYACEALFRARIHPSRPAGALAVEEAGRLVRAVRTVLRAAIDAGGSSLRDYVQADGELGNFQSDFRVYGRAGLPCVVCGAALVRLVQTGRSTVSCPHCQR